MTNVIDLNARRTQAAAAVAQAAALAQAAHASDTIAHIANTADAVRAMLRACSEEVTTGALDAARLSLAGAALAMLGPGWELRHNGQ